jgi:hypothetical protein
MTQNQNERIKQLENALRHIATMDCLTREGEEPAHILMMRIAERALTNQPTQDGGRGFHEAGPFPHPDSAEAKRRAAKPDQPADAGEPSVDQARFERVWKQLVYSLADFFALEITDAQAQSIAREVLKAAGAGEPPCCARTREAKPYHKPESSHRNADPTPDEIADPLFDVIWQVIKGWDVDTDGAGYHGATGNEAAAILRAIRRTGDAP